MIVRICLIFCLFFKSIHSEKERDVLVFKENLDYSPRLTRHARGNIINAGRVQKQTVFNVDNGKNGFKWNFGNNGGNGRAGGGIQGLPGDGGGGNGSGGYGQNGIKGGGKYPITQQKDNRDGAITQKKDNGDGAITQKKDNRDDPSIHKNDIPEEIKDKPKLYKTRHMKIKIKDFNTAEKEKKQSR